MTTPWLERAFIELAGKDSEEAQEILRRWVTTRQLTMGDYNNLADRLTVEYLERDTRRAKNFEHARSTGQLPPLAGKPGKRSKTGTLPALSPDNGRPAAKDPPGYQPPATGPLASMESLRGRKSGWRPR